jgi:4a-hydroxytetrahydrobiopterin dehydratase
MGVMARPSKLAEPEIEDALAGLDGWERRGDEIARTFECASFADAVAFVVRVGFAAEAADHHPDLDIRWRKVTVALTTHDAGGLTALDIDLATEITRTFAAFTGAR